MSNDKNAMDHAGEAHENAMDHAGEAHEIDGDDWVEDKPADDCNVCRQLRMETFEETDYSVVPAQGGGWQKWSEALLRYITKMGHQPTQAVIIAQRATGDRYLQFQLGHGIAHAEVGSNVYLMGDSRLTETDEAALARLGWREPASDIDDADEMPANWRLPLIQGDWSYLTQMVLATVVGVLRFRDDLRVDMHTFTCDNPCRDCSWPADAIEAEAEAVSG